MAQAAPEALVQRAMIPASEVMDAQDPPAQEPQDRRPEEEEGALVEGRMLLRMGGQGQPVGW